MFDKHSQSTIVIARNMQLSVWVSKIFQYGYIDGEHNGYFQYSRSTSDVDGKTEVMRCYTNDYVRRRDKSLLKSVKKS